MSDATIVRPALADVLAALTGKPPRLNCAHEGGAAWSRCDIIFEPTRVGYRNPKNVASAGSTVWHSWLTTPAAHAPLIACGAVVSVEVSPEHTITPAEAVEALYARETPLWPWSPGDEAAPRWWCDACTGCGDVWVPDDLRPCSRCAAVGSTAEPQSLASFVAVASLGVPTLRNAQGLAAQLVGRAPRVTFRVMAREALREHHERSMRSSGLVEPPTSVNRFSSVNHTLAMNGHDRARYLLRKRAPDDERLLLLDLAAIGLHIVALDGHTLTLAVEAI